MADGRWQQREEQLVRVCSAVVRLIEKSGRAGIACSVLRGASDGSGMAQNSKTGLREMYANDDGSRIGYHAVVRIEMLRGRIPCGRFWRSIVDAA